MIPLKQTVQRILALPGVLTRRDWYILTICAITAIAGIIGWTGTMTKSGEIAPAKGGVLKEGVIAESTDTLKNELESLTNAPLVKLDENGNIKPALAASWEIVDDGRKYVFKLVPGYSSTAAAETIKSQTNGLSKVETSTPDNQTLEIILKQPFSPILADLTRPIFPVGFYEIKKQSKNQVLLKARKSPLGEPFVETIDVERFTSQKSLDDALTQRRIDAAISKISAPHNYKQYNLTLPRRPVIFLNLAKPNFKDKPTRQRLAGNGEVTEMNFELTTINNSDFEAIARQFADSANSRGAQVTIRLVDAQRLQKEVVEPRDFDALLISVDFGRDPDTYSFWHSSQAQSGQNLSNFVNKKADRILEDARLINDQGKRTELYNQLQNILNDEIPAILFPEETLTYTVSDKIKGLVVNKAATSSERFGTVANWYIKTKKIKK